MNFNDLDRSEKALALAVSALLTAAVVAGMAITRAAYPQPEPESGFEIIKVYKDDTRLRQDPAPLPPRGAHGCIIAKGTDKCEVTR